jgi:hypothetical protein
MNILASASKSRVMLNRILAAIFRVTRHTFSSARLPARGSMSFAKLFLTGLVCAALAPVAFLAVSVSVRADDTPVLSPRIEVMPSDGPVGTLIFVRIFDFAPNKSVLVTFGTGTVISAGTIIADKETTDGVGYAVASFTLDYFAATKYTITADDGINKKLGYFTVTPKVTLDQSSGCVGDNIIVSGNGFATKKPISVFLDDVKVASGDADEKGKFDNIVFILPSSARGDHPIKVQDSEGNNAVVVYNVRQQMDISPAAVGVGAGVTINGTGFQSNNDVTIYFEDKEVTVVPAGADGSFQATITVPACSDGAHKIKANDGINHAYSEITVFSTMTVKPDNGYIGMPVGLQGSGFRAGFPMTVSYDNIKMDAPSVNANGSFTFNFKIPRSHSGPHTVTATDGVNVQKVTFTVESTPPLAPTLISPTDSARVIKDIHFEWNAVTDPSGVGYTLEIAADAKFTKVLLAESNLTSCSYDLPAEKQLLPRQNTPYYWRVKAVDGAENESAFSAIGSFYTGQTISTIFAYMPSWAEYALIGLGLALLAFMFFWIGRTVRKFGAMKEPEADPDAWANAEEDGGYNTGQNEWLQR